MRSKIEFLVVRCLKGENWIENQDIFVFNSKFPRERWGELVVDEEAEVVMITEHSKQRPDNKILLDLMVMDEKKKQRS